MLTQSGRKPITLSTFADKLLSTCAIEGAMLIASVFILAYAFGPDVQQGFVSGFACGIGSIGVALSTLAIAYKMRSTEVASRNA